MDFSTNNIYMLNYNNIQLSMKLPLLIFKVYIVHKIIFLK